MIGGWQCTFLGRTLRNRDNGGGVVVDLDHASSSNDLSNRDYRCWIKDYIVVVKV